jgi:hypothetical protein
VLDPNQRSDNGAGDTQGIICPPEVQVRRVEFKNYSPGELYMQGLYIAQWEEDQVEALTAQSEEADSDVDMFTYYDTALPFNLEGWCVPFVTGKRYRIYWGVTLVDHESMMVYVSD